MTSTLETPVATVTTVRPQRVHLAALDGVRGIASLYVVLGHVLAIFSADIPGKEQPDFGLGGVLAYGKAAVAVFIVLSGFCLMAPIILSGRTSVEGGFAKYILRRAKRILPPYYAAVAISLLAIFLLPSIADPAGRYSGVAAPAFRADVIVSHVLVIHNLNTEWIFKINPPFWSVATEWQIYFLFPLVFLPLTKKLGIWSAVIAGFLIGLVPHFLWARGTWSISQGHPWYGGLFAMGMLTAAACLSEGSEWTARALRRFGWVVLLSGVGLIALMELCTSWRDKKTVPTDLCYALVAVGFLAVLMKGCTDLTGARDISGRLRAFLDIAPIRILGSMSYSLYLIHWPVLLIIHRLTLPWHTTAVRGFAIMFGVGVPVILGIAFIFHWFFERPFMRRTATRVAAVIPERSAGTP